MVNLFAYFFISLISLIALSAIVTVLISQKIKRSIPKFGKITTLKDAEIHWYEIDETTHGSVAIYHSKEAYEANLAAQEQNRAKSTSEYSIQMLHEAHGESHVDFTSL